MQLLSFETWILNWNGLRFAIKCYETEIVSNCSAPSTSASVELLAGISLHFDDDKQNAKTKTNRRRFPARNFNDRFVISTGNWTSERTGQTNGRNQELLMDIGANSIRQMGKEIQFGGWKRQKRNRVTKSALKVGVRAERWVFFLFFWFRFEIRHTVSHPSSIAILLDPPSIFR